MDATSNKSTREFLKKRNKHLILNTIRKKGAISRHNITTLTGIRPATVIDFVNKLIKDGLVKEIGEGKSTGGRKPLLLELNPENRFAVGVHLGGTKIIAVVADLNGNIIHKVEKRSGAYKGKDSFTKGTLETITEVIKNSKIKTNKIIGIGLGIAGLVDKERGISLYCSHHSWWRDIPFKDIVEREFKKPTYVENDTRALTMGEKWFGAGKNAESFLYLEVSEGIGMGAFLNGGLYSGIGGSGGELGHTTIDKDGPLCPCGNHGCLETIASTIAIEKRMKELLEQGVNSLIKEEVKGNLNKVTFSTIVKAAQKGDKVAFQVLEDAGKHIGIGTANVVNLFNPALVIIGGLIAEAGNLILDPIRRTVKTCALTKLANEVDIRLTEFNETGTALGATTLVLEKLFEM